MNRLARIVQLLGILLLVGSPFLGWAHLPLGKLTLTLPGLFLLGGLVLALGLASSLLWMLRRRSPGPQLGVAGAAAGLTLYQVHQILSGTEKALGKLQLSLIDFNRMLRTLNLSEIELYRRGADPWSYLAFGPWLALAGAALLAAGSLGQAWALSRPEAGSARRARSPGAVLLGLAARCPACRHKVHEDMNHCPECGEKLKPVRRCRDCGQVQPALYRFCSNCGSVSASA